MKVRLSDGKKTKVLPGFDHKVTWIDGIKSEDQSGETSSTSDSYKGFKPGLITVTTKIRYKDLQSITDLSELFHATEDNKPVVYNIIHDEINAWGVQKVRFTNDIRLAPDGTIKVFNITLTLKQERSDPEKLEERTDPPVTADTKQAGNLKDVSAGTQTSVDVAAAGDISGTLETILKKANDLVGDLFFS